MPCNDTMISKITQQTCIVSYPDSKMTTIYCLAVNQRLVDVLTGLFLFNFIPCSDFHVFLCVLSNFLQYTEELLRQQQFLEVYLEGTRSRSGKPSTARAGMLSLVVDTLCTGSIPDVLVVPVGISYDRIIEGNYNSEQLVSALMMFVVCVL